MRNPTDHPSYRQHFVWKRVSADRALCYRCFESLDTGLFHIQSSDMHYLPPDAEASRQFDTQALELFLQADPADRSKGFPSLKQAIEAHESLFG